MTASTEQAVFEHMESLMEQLSAVDTTCRELEVEKDKRIDEIKQEFAPQIDPLTERRRELMEQLTQLFIEHESWLTAPRNKTAVFRSGLMNAYKSPGALVVEDEEQAMKWLRQKHKLLAFTRIGKRSLDKVKLKKHPELVEKIPGIRIEIGEFLSVKLVRTKIELTQDLKPYRRRIA